MLELHKSSVSNVYMYDIADMICQIYQIYIWRIIIFNNDMILIANIYVFITVSIIQLIYIHQGWKNSQHYMLANPDYNNISIEN